MLDNSYWRIPEHTFQALKRYIENRTPIGDFLYAVLTNDLMRAAVRADNQNRAKIYEICCFVHNEIPAISHGSKDKVQKWLKGGEQEIGESNTSSR